MNDNPSYVPTAPLPEGFPNYTYEEAVDEVALLLAYIGKDVGMIYDKIFSGAMPGRSYEFIRSSGFNVQTAYQKMDFDQVYDLLGLGCLVHLAGKSTSGHEWIADGYKFLGVPSSWNLPIEKFIHCNWGWNGDCNGYYNGNVFEARGSKYTVENYFAVAWTEAI